MPCIYFADFLYARAVIFIFFADALADAAIAWHAAFTCHSLAAAADYTLITLPHFAICFSIDRATLEMPLFRRVRRCH